MPFYTQGAPAVAGALGLAPRHEAEFTNMEAGFDAVEAALNADAPLNSPALTGTPTAPTATAGTNTTQIATTAFAQGASYVNPLPSQTGLTGALLTTDGSNPAWFLAGPLAKSVTVYTSGASNQWSKPPGAKFILVECWGAGGGGGGGASGDSTRYRAGGGGGGGGGYVHRFFNASDVPSSVTVAIGAGGLRGAGSTNVIGYGDGSNGGNGGATTFGSLVSAGGGGFGYGGQSALTATVGGVAGAGGGITSANGLNYGEPGGLGVSESPGFSNAQRVAQAGGSSGAAATANFDAGNPTQGMLGGCGGGAGATVSLTTGRAASAGGALVLPSGATGTGGAAGNNNAGGNGLPGGSGASDYSPAFWPVQKGGGGGGAATVTGVGGAGGQGGIASGGGGGGVGTGTVGGNGGNGGDGYCRITVW